MKALTIKQPWASLVAHGIKEIENRTWKTNYRGKIYIHAGSSAKFNVQLTDDQAKAAIPILRTAFDGTMPFGAIIGEVDIVDCVINHPSIWAEKTKETLIDQSGASVVLNEDVIYNWVLANPILYDKQILNVKGKLSFWEFNK